jgi:hypothetical protein
MLADRDGCDLFRDIQLTSRIREVGRRLTVALMSALGGKRTKASVVFSRDFSIKLRGEQFANFPFNLQYTRLVTGMAAAFDCENAAC